MADPGKYRNEVRAVSPCIRRRVRFATRDSEGPVAIAIWLAMKSTRQFVQRFFVPVRQFRQPLQLPAQGRHLADFDP